MPKNILLVEDDRVSRDSLSKLLTQVGHTLHAVWSAEEAKPLLANFTPEVALLDIRLPGIPGDAFAIYLQNKFPNIKIIFMSGELSEQTITRFGPTVACFPKPIQIEKLLATIDA